MGLDPGQRRRVRHRIFRRPYLLQWRGHQPTAIGGRVRRGHLQAGCLSRHRLDVNLDVEQEPDRLLLDRVHHGREHGEALPLVLHQRVALPHRPQPDALLQVVHLVEVLAPLAVEHRKHHPTLQLAGHVRSQRLLAPVVRRLDVGLQLLDQKLCRQPGPAAAGGLLQLLDRDPDRIQGAQRSPQLLEVPVLGVPFGGGGGGVTLHHVVHHVPHLLVQVRAIQHAAALGVDDFALLVEHLVVLEHVLADLEVLLLDLGLGRPDGPGHNLGLDRHLVRDAQPVHNRLNRRGVEQPHQVVAEGQIELRQSRVALATGATAQLVVDPPGLVPLGAEHVEAAGSHHLLMLGGDRVLCLGQRIRPGGFVVLRRLHRRQPAVVQLGGGQELRVAAEHDVGAAPGHVRRHRDRALASGLRDDGRLALVELGVEHLVRYAVPAQHRREQLGLRHTGGADQDGLAFLVPLGDVLDDGGELRLLAFEHHVLVVAALHRLVGRDGYDAE